MFRGGGAREKDKRREREGRENKTVNVVLQFEEVNS